MTNKEASIIIGNIPINDDGCYSISQYQEAKAMAIEALDRELQFLSAGYKNEEVEFYIGGRKFNVRELPQ